MIRTTTNKITFKHSFTLSDIEGEVPPGTYDVERDEKAIDEISFMAYSHVSTRITIGPNTRAPGRTVTYIVDPHELTAAISRDKEFDKRSIDDVQQFIRTGGRVTDQELYALIREVTVAEPPDEQQNLLRQIELSLDKYGGEAHLSATSRVASIISKLRAELDVKEPATVPGLK